MLAIAFWGGALYLAWILGGYSARERERTRIVKGQISRFEHELLRAQGNRVHPNPVAAGRVSRARITR